MTQQTQDFLPRESERIVEVPQTYAEMLSEQEGIFAQWFAETRSLVTSYTEAYPVEAKGLAYSSIWHRASNVLGRDRVAKRVTEIQDRLAAAGIVRAVEILQDLADIVNTDTNELVRHDKHNCRHCHGADGRYQWTDARELARQMDAYARQREDGTAKAKDIIHAPDPAGGFGYRPDGPVNPLCGACYGEGVARVWMADTRTLSPKARKLVKNIKQDRHGVITMELHDKMAARDMILKMLGGYKSDGKGMPLTGSAPLDGIASATQLASDDPRQVADAYLLMLTAGQ